LRRLKPFFNGFWLGHEMHFSTIEHYQSRLEHHKEQLKLSCLMLVHGDFHARNVMLNECQEQLKLIDLDRLDEYGDYILDFAQLVEDIALFSFVFDEENPRYLRTEQITFGEHDNMLSYPAVGTEATRLFQEWLLPIIETFAVVNQDSSWKHRLWLGIALHLLSLVNKPPHVHHAAVLYTEAIRLLDELTQSLDRRVPLPAIPFRAEHPISRLPTDDTQVRLVEPLHNAILEIQALVGQTLGIDIKPPGKVLRYYLVKDEPPIIVIDAQRSPPTLLLRSEYRLFDDPQGLLEPTNSTGLFQSRLTIDQETDVPYVAALVAQSLRHMRPPNGDTTDEL